MRPRRAGFSAPQLRRWSAKLRRRQYERTKEEQVSSSAALSGRGFSHWVFPRRSQTPRCWNPIGLNEPGDGRQVVGEGISWPKLFEPISHNTKPFRVTWLGRLRSPAHEQFVLGPKLLRELAQLLVTERPTTRRILLLLNRPTAECRNKVHQQILCSGCRRSPVVPALVHELLDDEAGDPRRGLRRWAAARRNRWFRRQPQVAHATYADGFRLRHHHPPRFVLPFWRERTVLLQ